MLNGRLQNQLSLEPGEVTAAPGGSQRLCSLVSYMNLSTSIQFPCNWKEREESAFLLRAALATLTSSTLARHTQNASELSGALPAGLPLPHPHISVSAPFNQHLSHSFLRILNFFCPISIGTNGSQTPDPDHSLTKPGRPT